VPATRPGTTGAVISGWGAALPDRVVTNDDLAATLDTSDEWITTRTGIRERHIGGSTVSLSVDSGRAALEMAGLTPDRIDALVLATTTPDRQWGTAAMVQRELGLSCGAHELNAACSGFVYGLINAHGLIAMGADRVLVIGTDTLSRITDWDDRATAPLFADGSGAVVVEAVDGGGQLLGWDLDADGSASELLWAHVGGTVNMEGKEVFRRAVRIMMDSAEKSMAHAGITADDLALIVPHQANIRIIQAACERLGVGMDRAAVTIDHTGNTSSASIPIALA
jgi:3-oxoacyl-[acyl-carrier-protein] synthase-3